MIFHKYFIFSDLYKNVFKHIFHYQSKNLKNHYSYLYGEFQKVIKIFHNDFKFYFIIIYIY
jgi:hypothetical protein